MNEELERKISLYLDGELDEREAAEVERLLGSDAEARALAEGFRRVGEELRALDPSAGVKASGGFFRSVLERARRREAAERAALRRLRYAAVAAAAAIAFLLAFFAGRGKGEAVRPCPPEVTFAMAFEFKAPGAEGWRPLPESPGRLAPGTVLVSRGVGLLKFADGSSVSAADGTVLLAGSSRVPDGFALLKGKLTVDVRGTRLRIGTQPAVLVCSKGLFEVSQEDPYRSPDSRLGVMSPRPWQWVTTLLVHSGVVRSGEDYFAESDCRVWAFDGPTGVQAAMLEDALGLR